MNFTYKNNQLHVENVAIAEIAKSAGTPFYLYSANQFKQNFDAYKNAFSSIDATICFAVKSNSNIAVLKLLQSFGSGADTVSGGEVRRAIMAGISPEKIILSGVGKTKEEIAYALENNIGQLNIESPEELEIINEIAGSKNTKARISVRVNPDVDAGTHEKIATGRKFDKFGIPWDEVWNIYNKAKTLPNLVVEGVACHIGSQITNIDPYKKAFAKVAELAKELQSKGFNLKRIDLGGGLGIKYKDETPIDINEYSAAVTSAIKPLGLKLFLEPGRSISASAGVLISEVQFIKHAGGRSFVVLDVGMNDLARPAIYGAYHNIIAVNNSGANEQYDIVGPVCESSDIFGRERTLNKLSPNDLVAIMDAGAYGAAMSSNYNTRGLLPEILVDGSNVKTIRERQSFEDMISLEKY